MMKLLFIILLFSFSVFGQVQIGQDIKGAVLNDHCGYSIDLSSYGNVVAVGSPSNDANGVDSGHVRIFEEIAGNWVQMGSDIEGQGLGDQNGFSLELSSFGNIIAMGAPFNDANGTDSGSVRIFEFDMGVWKQKGFNINGESIGEQSGFAVSLSSNGNTVAIGAPYKAWQGDIYNPSGTVRVYNYSNLSGTWNQVGQDIDGQGSAYYSGTAISLSDNGNILAVGTIFESTTGVVRIYRNVNGTWTQIGNTIYGDGNSDRFGRSISLSGDGKIIAIGGYLNDSNGQDTGHVRVYRNVADVWTQIGNDIYGEVSFENAGFDISLSDDGTTVALGAFLSHINGDRSGIVRIYENVFGNWIKKVNDIQGNELERSGFSVSLSSDGSRVAFGAPQFPRSYPSSSPLTWVGEGLARVYGLTKASTNLNYLNNDFSIFPNPATDFFNISLENGQILEKVTIYNNLGQIVKITNDKIIKIDHLSPGIYFVEVATNYGKDVKKIIIQ